MAKIEFYTIYSWMRDDLGLSGTELDCYAVIYCLSQGDNRYIAGIKNMMQLLHKSEPTIIASLKALTEKGLVDKEQVLVNNSTRYYYKAKELNEIGTKEILGGTLNNLSGGTLNNLRCNNIKENNIKENKKELLKNNSKKEENDSDFDEFYEAYPLKKGKDPAQRAWKKLTVKEKQLAKKVLEAYISDCIENNRSYKYPATYLNQKTWEDDFAGKEDIVDEIPADDVDIWERNKSWMKDNTPRIASKIDYKAFAKMRGMVMFKACVYAEILKDIEQSGYDGDIVKEFERLSDTEKYSKRITA